MNPSRYIDHTLLKPDTTTEQIRELCEQAVEYHFAAVCVPPIHVHLAADLLYGSDVQIATVVGFPLGYNHCETKIFETNTAIAQGATEIDMVINLGAARARNHAQVQDEIGKVVQAAAHHPVKVILEICYFEMNEVRTLAQLALDAGAHTLKTSTGFGSGGATLEAVKILVESAGGRAGVKAAGGIRDWETCRRFLDAGATRIGTSSALTIMAQWQQSQLV